MNGEITKGNGRVVKFRAWDKKLEHFVDLVEDEYNLVVMAQGDVKVVRQGRPINDRRFVLMQFTGLYDKHGKEIYMGDLLKVQINKDYQGLSVPYNWHFIEDETMIVIKDSGMYKLKPINPDKTDYPFLFCTWALELEIIGNIYEHSHLLNHE